MVADLFEPLRAELIALLRGLGEPDWDRPTSAGDWRVRDVVAHLLDGDLRRLSIGRDGHRPPAPGPIGSYDELVSYLNDLNAEWVRAARRISPRLLVEWLAHVGPQVSELMASADPFAPAPLAVAWAGQTRSPNWLDTGREYTERWHHQDQIREALGAPALTAERWLRPVIEISLRALPRAYRDLEADEGTAAVVEVTGEVRGAWSLVREASGWTLYSGAAPDRACRIAADAVTVARVLLHRLSPEAAAAGVTIEGDEPLGGRFLETRAVMV